MKTKSFLLLLVVGCILSVVLLVPSAQAWTWGEPLVPCGTSVSPTPCTRCELFHLLKNLIDFALIAVLPVGSTILFVLAGVYYILGGANPSFQSKGKDLFTNTLYGIVVIAMAWIITNTVLVNLSDGGTWGNFVCTNPIAVVPSPGPSTPGGPGVSPTVSATLSPSVSVAPGCNAATCGDPQALAQACGAHYPAENSQALNAVLSCIRANPTVSSFLDTSQIFTVEQSNPLCNYTHGQPICGACVHGRSATTPNGGPSCHYGGASGSNGAEAADLNARGGNEVALCRAIAALKTSCNIKFVNFEGDHTHISTTSCSGDNGAGIPCP